MKRSKKKEQVPVEPLQEPPNPMSCCDPAAPQVETFEEQVTRVTGSMSPEKSRVVRLGMEMQGRDEVCNIIRKCKRDCYRAANAVKGKMRADRRTIARRGKAPTKKELATRKADEEMLAACRKDYHNDATQYATHAIYATHAMIKHLHAKSARFERLLRDAGVEC